MKATIAICTYNHCDSLRETLAALGRVRVPDGLSCELIVVDNASTDATPEVVRTCRPADIPTRYLFEQKQGQCFARNAALEAADGEIIIFTDDDVRQPPHWIEAMSAPLVAGRCHALAGAVKIAPHLERPWMTWMHRAWLAATDYLDPGAVSSLVGANMAFLREVLHKVPAFDTELGPGALGFHDESLFSFQLREAGYKIGAAFDVVVEHHFDESRLTRSNFADTARKMGRSSAYLAHHWEHEVIPRPAALAALWRARLLKWRWQKAREWEAGEGMPEWEMTMLWKYHTYRHYLAERRRSRNYLRHGLVKLGQEVGGRSADSTPTAGHRGDVTVPSLEEG